MRQMTPEKALRWLIEFGSDWVSAMTLTNSWADSEIAWFTAVTDGYLERSGSNSLITDSYKLTDKAIKLIEELET